ncbi:hypothetical protein CVT25_001094 [Psilocybe cyanescens]|uniref:Retrovirus-related Pol polyprotein from transposon TNT 1-94-like beta-barrel domain-containing protein n=1 Tax=Psilocybe cyanescens TaxID=93625 RepID=A0A409XB90_PSICY|nr:hypothetical protein CVT25_001094 [Psilocybe cyanescens]
MGGCVKTSNSDKDTEWSILNYSNSGMDEHENAPVPSTIPDVSKEDEECLCYIMFSHKAEHTAAITVSLTHSSMPDLQSITKSISSGETDSLPDLEELTVSSEGSEEGFEGLQAEEENDDIFFESEDGLLGGVLEDTEVTAFAFAMLAGSATTRKAESNLYNLGALHHMTLFCHCLINYVEINTRPITTADKQVFHAIGKGDLWVRVPNGQTTTTILLKDVLYAPDMGLTIISISCIAAAGYASLLCSNFCCIFDVKQKGISYIHVTSNRLYWVDHGDVIASASILKMKCTLLELHQCMGHIAPAAVRALVEEGQVEGVELEDEREMRSCESCKYAKMTRKTIRKERAEPKAATFGNEVHSDVWGPASTQTLHHKQYYAFFTDDATHWSIIKLLHSKDDTFPAYKNFVA